MKYNLFDLSDVEMLATKVLKDKTGMMFSTMLQAMDGKYERDMLAKDVEIAELKGALKAFSYMTTGSDGLTK